MLPLLGHFNSLKGVTRKGESRLWYASSYERLFIVAMDSEPAVTHFIWQPFDLPYLDCERQQRRYTPDALVFMDGGVVVLYEVKPECFTDIGGKRVAAESWANAHEARFFFWAPTRRGYLPENDTL